MKVIECTPDNKYFQSLKTRFYRDMDVATFPDPTEEFLETCMVVVKDGKAISRAALFSNKNIMKERKAYAQVGSFESLPDQDAVNLLFDSLVRKTQELGFNGLVGPMNGSTWKAYRFNDRELKPFFTEYYHPAYYAELWENYGFKKERNYYSALAENINVKKINGTDVEKQFKHIDVREIDLDNLESDLRKVYRLSLEVFKGNAFYSVLDENAFIEHYKKMQTFMDPRYILLAEEAGFLVGYIFGLKDHHSAAHKTLIIKTLARHPSGEYRGVGHFLSRKLYQRACEDDFQDLIHAFMIDDGRADLVSQNFGGKVFRKYSLLSYEFAL